MHTTRLRRGLRHAAHISGAAIVCASVSTSARAQSAAPRDSVVVTHHQIALGGRTLKYTATAGLLAIANNEAGDVHGRIFFIAYTVDRPAGSPPRPLTFLWNGGPGSSSSQVHLMGFGPRRLKTADTYPAQPFLTGPELVDNQETWLDESDLVFVDPVGTGYSRPTKAEYASEFYNAQGDIESVAELIRVYRTRFNAFDAPLFLAGESYGVTRAMGVAEVLERRRTAVAGVILISNGIQAGQVIPPPLNSALFVPRFTATALYHKKLAADLQANQQDAMSKSETWARTVYAPALARRDSLSAAERAATIEQLRRFTGADSTLVDQKTLTISPTAYTNRLLADRNIELGRYDTRTSMPRNADTSAWQPTTDPSLRPVLDLMLGTSVPLIRYLRNELGFKSDLLYQGPFGEGYPGSTSFRGDWMSTKWGRGNTDSSAAGGRGGGRGRGGAAGAPAAPLQTAMTLDPQLRVLVLGGLYDTVVPTCQSIDEAIARIDAAIRPRVSARCYSGGHMMYTDKTVRAEMKRDVAAFIRGKGR